MSRNVVLTVLAAAVLVAVLATVIGAINAEPPRPEPQPQPAAEPQPPDPQDGSPDDPDRAAGNNQTDLPDDPPPQHPQVEPEPEPARSTLTRVPLDGQDIADMLGLTMWRFDFELVPDRYTIHLWVERWTPGADVPHVRHLVTASETAWGPGQIVVKLPADSDRHLFARIDDTTTRADDAEPLTPPHPWHVTVADHKQIRYSQAMHLVTFTYNESRSAAGGLRDVHRDHDMTVYIKARFVPGPFEPFDEPSAGPLGIPEPRLPAELTPDPSLDLDAEPAPEPDAPDEPAEAQ